MNSDVHTVAARHLMGRGRCPADDFTITPQSPLCDLQERKWARGSVPGELRVGTAPGDRARGT